MAESCITMKCRRCLAAPPSIQERESVAWQWVRVSLGCTHCRAGISACSPSCCTLVSSPPSLPSSLPPLLLSQLVLDKLPPFICACSFLLQLIKLLDALRDLYGGHRTESCLPACNRLTCTGACPDPGQVYFAATGASAASCPHAESGQGSICPLLVWDYEAPPKSPLRLQGHEEKRPMLRIKCNRASNQC